MKRPRCHALQICLLRFRRAALVSFELVRELPSRPVPSHGLLPGHTCGVRTGGTLVCWEYDDGRTTPPSGKYGQARTTDHGQSIDSSNTRSLRSIQIVLSSVYCSWT